MNNRTHNGNPYDFASLEDEYSRTVQLSCYHCGATFVESVHSEDLKDDTRLRETEICPACSFEADLDRTDRKLSSGIGHDPFGRLSGSDPDELVLVNSEFLIELLLQLEFGKVQTYVHEGRLPRDIVQAYSRRLLELTHLDFLLNGPETHNDVTE